MPTARACPDLAQYRRLASGQMSSAECETLLGHLEGCDACARRLEGLSEQDTLFKLIRQAQARVDAPAGQVVGRLVERLHKLRPADGGLAKAKAVLPGELAVASEMSFACPGCGKRVRATTEFVGKKVK